MTATDLRQTANAAAIRDERYRLLHRQATASQLGGLFVAFVLVALAWNYVSFSELVIWVTLFLAITTYRVMLWWRYRNSLTSSADTQSWHRYLLLALFASSSTWALAIVNSFGVSHPEFDVSLIAIAVCLIAGALGPLAPSLTSYLAYCLPISIAMVFELVQSDRYSAAMASGFIGFIVISALYARNMQSTVISLIELQFQNHDLLNELTQNQTKLQIAVQRAEAAAAEKSRFLAAASHDLAQPLHALELFMSALKRETDAAKRDRLIEKVGLSTTVLAEMFSGLLDLSKLENGGITPELKPVRVKNLLNSVADEYQTVAEQKGLYLRCKAADNTMVTDPLLLRRVLSNLISNALKNTTSGGISITATTEGTRLHITVEDTGSGFDAVEADKIFQEFYQVKRDEGLGLGLALVARLCKILDITVTAKSDPGKGSLFTLQSALHSAAEQTPQPALTEVDTLALRCRNIAYIDDDKASREAVASILTVWGAEGACHASLNEFVQNTANISALDIVLSDYDLGDGTTALDVIHYLESTQQDVPLLVISGESSSNVRKQMEEKDIVTLSKPVSEQLLAQNILRAMQPKLV